MAKAKKASSASRKPSRSASRGTSRRSATPAAAGPAEIDPLLQKTLTAVAERARMAGVSPVAYIRGVMTGRYERLSPRELGE